MIEPIKHKALKAFIKIYSQSDGDLAAALTKFKKDHKEYTKERHISFILNTIPNVYDDNKNIDSILAKSKLKRKKQYRKFLKENYPEGAVEVEQMLNKINGYKKDEQTINYCEPKKLFRWKDKYNLDFQRVCGYNNLYEKHNKKTKSKCSQEKTR